MIDGPLSDLKSWKKHVKLFLNDTQIEDVMNVLNILECTSKVN